MITKCNDCWEPIRVWNKHREKTVKIKIKIKIHFIKKYIYHDTTTARGLACTLYFVKSFFFQWNACFISSFFLLLKWLFVEMFNSNLLTINFNVAGKRNKGQRDKQFVWIIMQIRTDLYNNHQCRHWSMLRNRKL